MSPAQNTKNVIVTGASGYIGGTICIELKKQGYTVIGIDRRSLPKHLESYVDQFVNECFTHPWSLEHIEKKPVAVIHCAGTSLVGPSIKNPHDYYENNVIRTEKYLDYIRRWSPFTKFIFSSSAAVYGDPLGAILIEGAQTKPISPYGESKLMTEMMLKTFNKAYGLNYVAFRYFNACGAVEGGLHGQEPEATHIFAKIFEAVEKNEAFTLYGANYPTKDGTCVRDYVHVTDIAKAHILAIENNIKGIYNIGSVRGYSNLEIFDAVETFLLNEEVIHNKIVVHIEPNREGDPSTLIASSTKLKSETNWKPEKDLYDIIHDLYCWYFSENYMKLKKRSSNVIHPAI